MRAGKIHFLNSAEIQLLISSIRDLRHKVLILLMTDAGLRVSEAVNLKFGDFDFKRKLLFVNSLKKRNSKTVRQIPISQRLYLSLADYVKDTANANADTWLFPNPKNNSGPIKRDAVNKFLRRLNLKKLNIQNLHPHALRHSFATSLIATGSSLHEIADLLGHEKLDTARIYSHIPEERLRQLIDASTIRSGFRKWYGFFRKTKYPALYIPNQTVTEIIGRKKEFFTISDFLDRNTNILLVGPVGVGKRSITFIPCGVILSICFIFKMYSLGVTMSFIAAQR